MGSLLASNIMSSTFGYYFACISSVLNKWYFFNLYIIFIKKWIKKDI